MIEYLINFDQHAFLIINGKLQNVYLDSFLPLVRNKYIWAPLYAFIISYLIINYRLKGLLIILFTILTVVLCDQISSSLIKPLAQRLRPCNDPILGDYVRLLVPCGGGFSFISSHASNHFGIAMTLGLSLKQYKWVLPTGIAWATLISYAQIYVGVHYPFDILGGAVLGITCGWLVSFLLQKLLFFRNKNLG